MSPIDVVKWSCVAIFVITSVLTLMHVSGIRTLPDPNQGKILFKALIVEIVVIAVAAFGSTLIPKQFKPIGIGIAGPNDVTDGMEITSIPFKVNDETYSMPDMPESASVESEIFNQKTGKDCHEITVKDYSKHPPTSRIETVCENN